MLVVSGRQAAEDKKEEEEEERPKYVLKDQQRKDEYPSKNVFVKSLATATELENQRSKSFLVVGTLLALSEIVLVCVTISVHLL